MTAVRCLAVMACVVLPAVVTVRAAQNQPVFRLTTSGVAVDVSVTDGRRAVAGLGTADFELLDNGVPQVITAAALEFIPIDVTLVVDTSASLTGALLAQFKQDVVAIGGMLRAEDRIRLITFATRGADAFGWRPGGGDLPLSNIAAGGATAFYQTLAAALLRQTDPGRRHLIVALSDGFDTVSLLDGADVRDLARAANAVLHVVIRRARGAGGGSRGWVPYTGAGNTNTLREAAEATGGRFRTETEQNPLTDAFKAALDEFRTGYVLWYTPAGVAPTGWHAIRVRARQARFTVRARNGYDAGGGK
jgi:hypothetical protein